MRVNFSNRDIFGFTAGSNLGSGYNILAPAICCIKPTSTPIKFQCSSTIRALMSQTTLPSWNFRKLNLPIKVVMVWIAPIKLGYNISH